MLRFKDKKRPYIILKTFILDLEDLSMNEKVLLCYLHGLVESGKDCEMSNAWLAWVFMVDVRTIGRWLKKLEDTCRIKRKLINNTDREIFVLVHPSNGRIIIKDDNIDGQVIHKEQDYRQNCPGTIDKTVQGLSTFLSINNKEDNKDYKKETASGTLSSEQLSTSEKEALALLKSKFNDNRITIKQLRELLKVHTHKDLKWSIDNYLYDLENQTEKVSNKIVVFTMRLKTQGKGYYEDSRAYHKEDSDRTSEDMQKPKLKIDLPVQKLTLVKNDSINQKKREALAYECFKKWQRHAPNSLYERYGENVRAFFDYFKTRVFPHLNNNDINRLLT